MANLWSSALTSVASALHQGRFNLFSRQQGEDFYDTIEWAAHQPWSTGKVGLLGISYYALTQWQVAALQPPHLAAIIPWEGMVDLYRDASRQGECSVTSSSLPGIRARF